MFTLLPRPTAYTDCLLQYLQQKQEAVLAVLAQQQTRREPYHSGGLLCDGVVRVPKYFRSQTLNLKVGGSIPHAITSTH